jgi:hypothetical protein
MRPLLAALAAVALLAPATTTAQPLRPQVDAWRKAHERAILDEAFALLAIPNVASNQDDIAQERGVHHAGVRETRRGAHPAARTYRGQSRALW